MTSPAPEPTAAGHRVLLPEGWPKPRGYANGVVAEGRVVYVGGQIGWDATGQFSQGFVAQARQTFQNIVAVLAEAGAGPHHLVRLTWFVVDLDAYAAELKAIGHAYREVIGPHYPAMSVVQVARLVEPEARLEIEATAVIPA